MIIRFSVENWMSFREECSFSMIASREKQHGERIARVKKYPVKILPVTAVYGANAAGKSNFFEALYFMRQIVVHGRAPDYNIPVRPFLLDSECVKKPSRFQIELLAEENIYEFSFSATKEAVLEEKLLQITKDAEKILYERTADKIRFDASFKGETLQFLKFIHKGTRENQLFLTNSFLQNAKNFTPVYNWFKNMEFIEPDTEFWDFERLIKEQDSFGSEMNKILSLLDSGISGLGGVEVSLDSVPLPKDFKLHLLDVLKEDHLIPVSGPRNQRFIFSRNGEELKAHKLITYHSSGSERKVEFEFYQESDGTRRLIDLLPYFLGMTNKNVGRIFIIDELDRSLHTLLTRKLLELYLAGCLEQSRNQLLFTTHDVLLMDQSLLRRDEMWIAEREENGNSKMYSFSEYKDVRNDKDIRKSYLQGRLGGIPRILLEGSFGEI
jgi:AAA15 family ATPase/GTPase